MQLSKTTTRREFHPNPDLALTSDYLEELTDQARKQYHRDYGETTRNTPGWLHVAITENRMHFYYDYIQEHTK